MSRFHNVSIEVADVDGKSFSLLKGNDLYLNDWKVDFSYNENETGFTYIQGIKVIRLD